LYGLW
jgi:hypothetical protein